MRDHGGRLDFSPRLPRALTRLAFRLLFRGRRMKVEVEPGRATYTLLEGDPLTIHHYGEELTISGEEPSVRELQTPPRRRPPKQPAGRAPARRRPPPAS
jgi:alpha,alpha-trehalose phosphorylase